MARISSQAMAVALAAMTLALTAALPISLDNEAVELVDEGGAWSDLWFKAIEEKHNDVKELGPSLGESDGGRPGGAKRLPEANYDTGIDLVPSTRAPDQTKKDVRDPPKPSNPYAQQVDDMKKMKKSFKQVRKEHRKYVRTNYYDIAPSNTKHAVLNAIEAAQNINHAAPDYGKKIEWFGLDASNEDLVEAKAKQAKAEAAGEKLFAVHKKEMRKIAGIQPSPYSGEFGKLYIASLGLKKNLDAAAVMDTLKPPKIPKEVQKKLGTKKKRDPKKDYDRNQVFNAKKSKPYVQLFQNMTKQVRVNRALKAAARMWKVDHAANKSLTYASTVKGTVLEGVKNVYAESANNEPPDAAEYHRVKDELKTKEKALDTREEAYTRRFGKNARLMSMKEFNRYENIDRQVRKKVFGDKLPVDGVGEAVIEKDAAKLKKQHEEDASSVGLKRDVATMQKADELQATEHDREMTAALRAAPRKADLKKLEKEQVLGARQLAKDTKIADRRLAKRYESKKKRPITKLPNWKKLEKEVNVKQKQKLVRLAYQTEMRDATKLSTSGTTTDLRLMRHDQKAIQKHKLTAGPDERKLIDKEEKWKDTVRKELGERKLNVLTAGIKALAKRDKKDWKRQKKIAKSTGAGPRDYDEDSQVLQMLPDGYSDPLVSGDISKINYSGVSSNEDIPLNRDVPPPKFALHPPKTTKPALNAPIMKQREIEKQAKNTPKRSEDAEKQVDDAIKNAKREAAIVKNTMVLSGDSKTVTAAVKGAKESAKVMKDTAKIASSGEGNH